MQTTIEYNNGYVQEQDYTMQEDEWDRDLLLDPAWEKQQRKVGRISITPLILLTFSLCYVMPYMFIWLIVVYSTYSNVF